MPKKKNKIRNIFKSFKSRSHFECNLCCCASLLFVVVADDDDDVFQCIIIIIIYLL